MTQIWAHTLERVFLVNTREIPNWVKEKYRPRGEKYPSPDKSSQVFVGNTFHTLGFAGLFLPIELLVRIVSFEEGIWRSDEKEKAVF